MDIATMMKTVRLTGVLLLPVPRAQEGLSQTLVAIVDHQKHMVCLYLSSRLPFICSVCLKVSKKSMLSQGKKSHF